MNMSLRASTEQEVRNPLLTIFVGSNGLRAGWRILIFFVLTAPLIFLAQQATKLVPAFKAAVKINMQGGSTIPLGLIVIEATALLPMLFVAWLMSRFERRKFGEYGLPLHEGGKFFLRGMLWGLATEACTTLLIFALGGYSFGSLALDTAAIVRYSILWAIAFLLVGVQEEFCFRGYLLRTLSSGIRFWPAALVTSLPFALWHLSNPGENWIGVLYIVLWALVMCLTIRRTGSLWFAVGFHAASDYAMTFLFSVNNSGTGAQGQLLHSVVHGPAWLTGGNVGPEGSIFSFVSILLFAGIFSLLYKSQESTSHFSFTNEKAGQNLTGTSG
jgi:uncharacterized protein